MRDLPDAPLAERIRAAHLLGGILGAQAVAAALGVGVAFLDGRPGIAVVYAGLAGFALLAAIMEWRRHVQGELVAFLSFVYGVAASILALPFGFWYYVPILGATTLVVMLALLYRVAVRSEARHKPRVRHV